MEQLGELSSQEFQRLGIPIYDLARGPPFGTAQPQTFPVTSQVRARITPMSSLYFLDWVDHDGTRITTDPGLIIVDVDFDGVYETEQRDVLEPLGFDMPQHSTVETFMLHPARIYQICPRNEPLNSLKTITFPVVQPMQRAIQVI
ncbi:hypothetical protein EW146_g7804 [Bondarzewia mesenterica]|uniref:Uncharacterized protein n=1 Tax=Bondarzewia mesenterica TaxID=1095465 RepID=A0A4S4LJF6_9AGAM|nr:hypothetical protein EW146_g7804 [Bondarzewia mesenterica]